MIPSPVFYDDNMMVNYMNKRARNQLLLVIIGLGMMLIGMVLFLTKTKISSNFLNTDGGWPLWGTLLVLLPLAAGIVMLIVKPKLPVSKWLAICGAILVIVMIVANIKIVIRKKIAPIEWVIYGFLIIGGVLVSITSLFIRRKN